METFKDYPQWFVALCASIFAIEGLVGFLFNLLVLAVYHLNQRTLKNVSNILITNLNIIDMLICLVCCPVSLTYISTTRFHDTVICYIHEASVAFASTASAVNLLFISFDRYESIAVPMKRKIKETNVKLIVAVIWVLAVVAVILPFCGYFEVVLGDIFQEASVFNDSVPCSFWHHKTKAYFVHDLYFILAFLTSSLVTLVCYYRVFRVAKQRLAVRIALLKSSLSMPASKPLMDLKKQQDKRLTTVTLAIVCTFMICWGPNMIVAFGGLFLEPTLSFEMAQTGLLCLAYLTTILHPLLYAFLRENFREALLEKWRLRPNVNQTKVFPSGSDPYGVLNIGVPEQKTDYSDDLPTVSRLINPTNTVTVSIQDSLVLPNS